MYYSFTAAIALLASCTVLLLSTAFVTAEEAVRKDPSDLLEIEIIPSFAAVLVGDETKMSATCAAEPGPAVCTTKVLTIADKMRSANSETSFLTYIETLADASLFFKDCWSCLISDMTNNGHFVEELCRSLEDVSFNLKNVYFASTSFPVPSLCNVVLFKHDEAKGTPPEVEALLIQEAGEQVVGVTSTYNFDKCSHITTKIDFRSSTDSRSSTRIINSICKPDAGTALGNAVDVGTSSLGILLDGSDSLPYVGFAASAVKAIYAYACAGVGEDSGAKLDANKVYKIATEAAKDAIGNLITNRLQSVNNNIQADLGNPNVKPNAEQKIPTNRVVSYASSYMNVATDAGTLGIAGYKTAVAALSHSLTFLALAKDVALKENHSECAAQIEDYLLAFRDSMKGIQTTAKTDFTNLRNEKKKHEHKYINRWYCTLNIIAPFPGFHNEYEAYVQDRRSKGVDSTRARYQRGAWNLCNSDATAKSGASELATPKVNAWLNSESKALFTIDSEQLFKDIDDKTRPPPTPTPRPPTPRPPTFPVLGPPTPRPPTFPHPCLPWEYCPPDY